MLVGSKTKQSKIGSKSKIGLQKLRDLLRVHSSSDLENPGPAVSSRAAIFSDVNVRLFATVATAGMRNAAQSGLTPGARNPDTRRIAREACRYHLVKFDFLIGTHKTAAASGIQTLRRAYHSKHNPYHTTILLFSLQYYSCYSGNKPRQSTSDTRHNNKKNSRRQLLAPWLACSTLTFEGCCYYYRLSATGLSIAQQRHALRFFGVPIRPACWLLLLRSTTAAAVRAVIMERLPLTLLADILMAPDISEEVWFYMIRK